ncbi:MAG: hypothetical protein JRH15_05680 [Deltaproteobacteria bacterium]|nr:hypothetical protein [Deltaproteobacteria bacterium]
MDFKTHLETAWKQTIGNIIPLLIMTLVLTVVSVLTLGILAPVTGAGFIQSLIRMVRDGREPTGQDIFSHMNLFLPLFGFTIIVVIAVVIGFLLLFLPGLLIILALAYFCIYMIPLMTDKQLGLMDAIKESKDKALGTPVMDHVLIVIIYLGIQAVGSSIFIGFLFTLPLATAFLASVYCEKYGDTGS